MVMMRKGGKKHKCHVIKYNKRIKMRGKTFLLEFSTQPEDHTKVARVVHPQVQHRDNLFHS
jgi:hypothetical protein